MSEKPKIYTDVSSLTQNNLKNLNPLLSFHWSNLDEKAILSGKSRENSPLKLVSDPQEAEWFILPMHWTYYLWNGKARMNEAVRLAELAKKNQKKMIVWFRGDLMPVVPFENAAVFLPGIVKSIAKPNQQACPVFIEDPLPNFSQGKIFYREKKQKPTIGFCGYAEINRLKVLWSIFKGTQLNVQSRFGRYDYEAVPVVPATVTRAQALKLLAQDSGIETSFIIRDKHCHDQVRKKSLEKGSAAHVFYSNILETDYTLCLRGYGNWSYRFYETLACGRIPVLIDTDCVLPNDSNIDWKKYCVWVDKSELKQIGEKIADFHSSLSSEDFIERQISCRRLWEEQLTPEGFMKHIQDYLEVF